MPVFSRELEKTLHRAIELANEKRHEFSTLEHLLLALIIDADALIVFKGCNVDIDKLTVSLNNYINTELDSLVMEKENDKEFTAKPTAGFQRVVQRATIHVQTSNREVVTGANILIAIFAERESHAAYFLREQDFSHYDAINYINNEFIKIKEKLEKPLINDIILKAIVDSKCVEAIVKALRDAGYFSGAQGMEFGSPEWNELERQGKDPTDPKNYGR